MTDELTVQQVVRSLDDAQASLSFMTVLYKLLKEHIEAAAAELSQEVLENVQELATMFNSKDLVLSFDEADVVKLTDLVGERGANFVAETLKRCADDKPLTIEMVNEAYAAVAS